MLKKLFLLSSIIFIVSCKSTKTVQTKKRNTTNTTTRSASTSRDNSRHETTNEATINSTNSGNTILVDNIVEDAKQYQGTRYKYGGTNKRGIDCSGLVVTAFNSENIALPRTTSELSTSGNWVDLKEVQKGDLLFFATRKNSMTVNHVGIVTEARVGHVEFIHASTSAGVIISSLSERYWYFAFVQARRIL